MNIIKQLQQIQKHRSLQYYGSTSPFKHLLGLFFFLVSSPACVLWNERDF